MRTEPGEIDSSGRRQAIPVPGSEFRIDATGVISAAGQRPDLSWNEEGLPFALTPHGTFAVGDDGRTNVEGVYAAGDAVSGSTTVVEAMAGGRRVAGSVARYLHEVQ